MPKHKKQNPKHGLKLLSIICFLLFCSALFFQHILGMEPCIKCIHQRIGVLLLGILFAIAAIAPRWLRLILYIVEFGVTIKTFFIARDHAFKQHNIDLTSSCGYSLDLPSWFAIDVWLPEIFKVRGICDQINMNFLGHTMPELLSYALLTIAVYLIWILLHETKLASLSSVPTRKR